METLTLSQADRERFQAKFTKEDGCWTWKGTVDDKGYGRVNIGLREDRKLKYAHRIAYETTKGMVPEGLKVDHVCHNRLCVNPSHLRLLTHKQNLEHRAGPNKNNIRSGVRGVGWHPRDRTWTVSVGHNGKVHYGGSFKKLEDASAAVVELRKRLHTHNLLDRIPA